MFERDDAGGQTGGGSVLVGGDYQGGNTRVQNSNQTYVGRDVEVNADAVESGDGGKVIVWADNAATVKGTLSARGGEASGDGGFIETSGKVSLHLGNKAPDASARRGNPGKWLLDPRNAIITTTTGTTTESATNPDIFTPQSNDDAVDVVPQLVQLPHEDGGRLRQSHAGPARVYWLRHASKRSHRSRCCVEIPKQT